MLSHFKSPIYRALRWSERYTKTDMLYLTKGGFWLLLGHGFQMLSGLVLAVAFASLLPKDAYGTYQFIMAGAAILSTFTLSGMSTAITRAVAKGSESALPYGFRVQIFWSFSIVLCGGIISLYYYINGNTTLASAFLIVGALVPLVEGFSLYRSYLLGKHLFRESTMLGLWRRPFPVIAVLTALFLTDDPVILVFVYFASNAVSAALLYLLVLHRYRPPLAASPELVNYSKHLSVLRIVSAIADQADKIAVWVLLGATPLAVYSLATLPYAHLQKMFGLVSKLVFPKIANRDLPTLQKTLSSKVVIFFVATLGTVIAYVLVAPYLYALLFPLYPEAVLLSQAIMLALLAKPRSLYAQVFAAHGMKRVQYILRFSVAAVKLSLLAFLLPMFGLWGAVYALLGTHLYASILTQYFFFRAR